MADVVRSALLADLGVTHGFSLRTGGASAPPYDSLNLGRNVGDDPVLVEDNHRRLAAEVGYAVDALFEVSQVHGAGVVRLPEDARYGVALRDVEADALVARPVSGGPRAVGVRTADCVPLLVVHPPSGVVAAVHAGWRGAVAGVVAAGVQATLEEAGPTARAEELAVAIGPHIRGAAFEVGPEVAAALAEAAGPGARVIIQSAGRRPRVDLAGVCRAQLSALGVPASRVDDVGGCSVEDPDRFFSHRRDRGRTGRHLAVVATP